MKSLLVSLLFFFSFTAFAEVRVVATTTVIYDLVSKIGKDKVKVEYLCRGDQDPHYLEILPSYMLKLRDADIVFKIGLDLERWLPQLIDGSRNSRIIEVDLSKNIQKKDIPTGKIDASKGDIHPNGNPHYWLDPENAKIMAQEICNSLSDFSPPDAKYFKTNLDNYLKILNSKTEEWKKKMQDYSGKQFIFFHASWTYFSDRYNLKIAGYVEPKPGVPPTPSHNAEIIQIIKKNNIKYIIMENYYSDNAPNQIAKTSDAKVIKVPIAVFGTSDTKSYIQMMDYIINQITSH